MLIKHDLADGFHKLGRIFLAAVTTVVMGWVIIEIPDISVEKLILIASVPMTYIIRKGHGYTPNQKQDNNYTPNQKQDKNPVTDDDFSD